MRVALLMVAVLAFGAEAADDNLAARRMFYQDNNPEAVFKATTVAQKPADAKPVAKPTVTAVLRPPNSAAQAPSAATKVEQIEKIQQALRDASTTALNSSGPSLKPVSNLGVRYNILKVNLDTRDRTEVPPDTVFHEKDCVAVRIQPNRGGFLYVFAEESSGRFRPLIPSEETADDSNIVRPYNLMDVPQNYCFEMDDKPGTERLLIVVTDKPEDVMKLNDTLKNGGKPEDGGPRRTDSYVVAANDLKFITGGLQGRDLKITRVGNRPAVGEAPYSTYLTNAAATTADRLVLEVKLKHEK